MKKIIIGLVIAACIQFLLPLFLVIVLPILVVTTLADAETETNPGSGIVVCNETQSINMSMWNEAFGKANALANSGDTFIRYSEEYNLDPVLFSAIAMHETGWGTSKAVKNYNNPGGLMNPATNWSTLIRYPNLDEGIHAMAKTLNKLINERGLVTINELGSVYAPLDAANDPNGLNVHWVPTVTKFANEFGGLTMNCEKMGQVELIGDKAWPVPHTKNITSGFGPRWGGQHNGIDIAGGNDTGKPIVSFMDGTVIVSTFGVRGSGYGGYGNVVVVEHSNGVKTLYGHMHERAVPVGAKVKAGELLGYIGNTGDSKGAHLHFEIRINNKPVDPKPYLTEFLSN